MIPCIDVKIDLFNSPHPPKKNRICEKFCLYETLILNTPTSLLRKGRKNLSLIYIFYCLIWREKAKKSTENGGFQQDRRFRHRFYSYTLYYFNATAMPNFSAITFLFVEFLWLLVLVLKSVIPALPLLNFDS